MNQKTLYEKGAVTPRFKKRVALLLEKRAAVYRALTK